MSRLYLPQTTDTKGRRQKIFHIIFGYQQRASIAFDVMLVLAILLSVAVFITIFGALLFIIEGPKHGFTSIPTSMYWALISVSTVGYGDISPLTAFGQLTASVLVLIETFARVNARTKMVKIRLIFVEKLANSQLLAAFSASIRQIFPHFSFAPHSCKGL